MHRFNSDIDCLSLADDRTSGHHIRIENSKDSDALGKSVLEKKQMEHMNGKGDRPRNNFSRQFRENFGKIDWKNKRRKKIKVPTKWKWVERL